LWAVGRYDLGLSEQELWGLNLKKLNALMERYNLVHKQKKKEADFRAGIISSTLANIYRDKKKKPRPYKPKDFMPQKKKKQTWKKQLQMVEVFNKAMGGEDKRGGS